jgi:hypothetical protein
VPTAADVRRIARDRFGWRRSVVPRAAAEVKPGIVYFETVGYKTAKLDAVTAA